MVIITISCIIDIDVNELHLESIFISSMMINLYDIKISIL